MAVTVLIVVFPVVSVISCIYQGSPAEQRKPPAAEPQPSPAPATKLAPPTGILFRLESTITCWCCFYIHGCNVFHLQPVQHQSLQPLLQVVYCFLQYTSPC